LKEAKEKELPVVIAFDIPDDKITGDVKDLTGDEGKIIFISMNSKDKDAVAIKHRYGLNKAGAVLTDEFGNLLKRGLTTSDEIVDAYYELDELVAGAYQAWTEAIRKGETLIKKKQYPEAAKVLHIFAFATGTDEAEKGKKLFGEVAKVASQEFEALAAETKEAEAGSLDSKTRKALITKLSDFIAKWPGTEASFTAETLKNELSTTKGAL
jgi:hypothetical protein